MRWIILLVVALAVADFTTTVVGLNTLPNAQEKGVMASCVLERYGLWGLALADIGVVTAIVAFAVLAKRACERRGDINKGKWAVRLMLYPYMLGCGFAVANNAGHLVR